MRIPRRRIGRPAPEHNVVSLWIRTTRVPTRTRTSSIARMSFVIGQYAVWARPRAVAANTAHIRQRPASFAHRGSKTARRNAFCRRTPHELSSTFDCGKRGTGVGCGSGLSGSLRCGKRAEPTPCRCRAALGRCHRAHAQSPSTGDDGGTLALLAGAVFLAMLVIGGIALVAVRLPRPALVLPGGRYLPNADFRLPFRPPKGGLLMSKARRRLWARGGSNTPTGRPEEHAGGNPHRIVDRLAEYAPRETQPSAPAPDDEAHEEPLAAQEAADVPADLSALGHQVGAVLESAQETAAPHRRTGPAEAAKRRDEVEAEAAAAIEEARRSAEADRVAARRAQSDAEAYAAETRAAADTYAEKRRAEAERESEAIAAGVQSRLAAADAEVERKVREAEARAHGRVEMLKAEAERYEERLDNLFVVFREMSSQLEKLIGASQTTKGEHAGPGEGLEDALRPDPSTR